MTAEIPHIRIDIVSDVVCPWCIIGYRQLEQAVATLAGQVAISLHWHPFELAPGLGPEGKSTADHIRERYGATPEQSKGNRARIIEVGAALGIDFRYGDDSRMYNTYEAHQLLHWAADSGKQTALKLALFHAYFTDQINISDTDILVDLAAKVGLDGQEARAVLDDGRFAKTVSAEIDHWQDHGVSAVPAFIINGKAMIPGAQDAATFVQVIERVVAKGGLVPA
jgi:predicted DsbA family dithiol-disulfide isomerase